MFRMDKGNLYCSGRKSGNGTDFVDMGLRIDRCCMPSWVWCWCRCSCMLYDIPIPLPVLYTTLHRINSRAASIHSKDAFQQSQRNQFVDHYSGPTAMNQLCTIHHRPFNDIGSMGEDREDIIAWLKSAASCKLDVSESS